MTIDNKKEEQTTTTDNTNHIHNSHDMTEWRGSIVTLINTSRFGQIRECKKCGAEEVITAAGSAMHDELKFECCG